MTREEAIKTLKENVCAICAYGAQNMDSCDIRSCDNRDAIKALEQESTIEEEYEYVYIGNGAYEKRPKVKSEPTTKNDLADDKTFYEQIVEYCNEHFLVLVEKDVWEDARKALTTKNNLGVDAVSRQAVLEMIADYDLSMGQVVKGIHALSSVTPQPCEDAVSRKAINGYIDYILSHGMGKKKSFDFIKKFVANLPSVTPQEPCDKCEVTFKDDNAVSRLSVRDIIYANAYELEYPDSSSEYVVNRDELIKYLMELPSVYPKSDKPLSFKEMMDRLNLTTDDIEKAEDLDFEIESLMPSYSNLLKANNQLKKQIEMLKLDRDCDKPSGKWILNAPQYDMLNPQYICSECGNAHTRTTPYCEMCGAKMVKEQTGENT